MSCVEALVAGSKIKSSNQGPFFDGRSRDQGDHQTAKPMDQECMAAIEHTLHLSKTFDIPVANALTGVITEYKKVSK